MSKKEILKKYNNKLKLLRKYNKSYYNNNKPLVSDRYFDELKKEILKIEH